MILNLALNFLFILFYFILFIFFDSKVPGRFYRTIDWWCSIGYHLHGSFVGLDWCRLDGWPLLRHHQKKASSIEETVDRCRRSYWTIRWTVASGRWLNLHTHTAQKAYRVKKKKEKKERRKIYPIEWTIERNPILYIRFGWTCVMHGERRKIYLIWTDMKGTLFFSFPTCIYFEGGAGNII